jgi:hypothetical protein
MFRRWAGVATIAAVLERKVWLRAFNRTLYPNLYTLLVGGPGVGKTDAIRNVIDFWNDIPGLHVAPSSVSRASLTDALNSAERTILRPLDIETPFLKFNSLQVAATEFGTFLTAYDGEFLSTLNDLYDNVRYNERKRSMKDEINIPKPNLSLIAGTTPAWLGGTLPETAWAEGFSSRLLMVYSGDRIKIDPFATEDKNPALRANLLADLRQIHELFGQISFDEKVVDLFRAWYTADCPPIPTHPKLEHYLPRRHIHFLKLCMVMSVSRSSEMVIRVEDFQAAQDLLLETEAYMPDVFKSMRYNSDANVIDEAYNFVWTAFTKEQKPIAEHRIINFLAQRMPSHSVAKVLEVMVDSDMLAVASISDERGRKTYRPTPRATHSGSS